MPVVTHTVNKALRREMPVSPLKSNNVSAFVDNMIVTHPKFGKGRIVEITGENAKIDFENIGVKILNLRLAPLQAE